MAKRIVELIISIGVFIFLGTFQTIRRGLGIAGRGTLVVITYHSVYSQQEKRFEKQMEQLIKVSRPVFADIEGPLEQGVHHVAVTFDDGFQSVVKNALPIMFRKRIPATFFIPVGYLGKRAGWIKNPIHENFGAMVVSEEQLKCLLDEGVKIGSHGITHPRLTTLNGEEIKDELLESKLKLETILFQKVNLLAFPNNDFNQEVLEVAGRVGYSRAFANMPTCPISKIDGLLMGRIHVSPEDWGLEYLLKIKGWYQWLHVGIKLKRKLVGLIRLKDRKRFDKIADVGSDKALQ